MTRRERKVRTKAVKVRVLGAALKNEKKVKRRKKKKSTRTCPRRPWPQMLVLPSTYEKKVRSISQSKRGQTKKKECPGINRRAESGKGAQWVWVVEAKEAKEAKEKGVRV